MFNNFEAYAFNKFKWYDDFSAKFESYHSQSHCLGLTLSENCFCHVNHSILSNISYSLHLTEVPHVFVYDVCRNNPQNHQHHTAHQICITKATKVFLKVCCTVLGSEP